MPVEGYTNITMRKEQQAKIRKLFDIVMDKQFEWIDWLGNSLESVLLREKFLKQNFPHIRFVGNVKDGCVLEDTKSKTVVMITIKGNKITSTPPDEQCIFFAMLTPRLMID